MIWKILTIVNLLAVTALWGLVYLAVRNVKKKKKQLSASKSSSKTK